MATNAVAVAKHATLTGTTVDTVILTQAYRRVEVVNRSTAGFSITYGQAQSPSSAANITDPTALGDDTTYVPPGSVVTLDANGRVNFAVKIIGAGDAYSVQGVDE